MNLPEHGSDSFEHPISPPTISVPLRFYFPLPNAGSTPGAEPGFQPLKGAS